MSSTQALTSKGTPDVSEGASEDWPVIAVMGVTGAGKSTFISDLVGNNNVIIGHSLKSETKLTAAYRLDHEILGRIELLDTPGFDDTFSADTDVLREIAAPCGPRKTLLSQELVGDGGFWAEMARRGSPVRRWLNRSSPYEIIGEIMSENRASGPATLQIQRELVDERKRLERTAAGQEVDRELNKVRQMFEKQLQSLRDENTIAMKEQDVEWQTALREQRKELERQQQLIDDGQKAMQVTFEQLCVDNKEKYDREISRLKQELERAEVASEMARLATERKEAEIDTLRKELGDKTESEQGEEDRKQLQDAEEEQAKLVKELEEKRKKQISLRSLLLLLGHAIATTTNIVVQLVV
ncbi:hypothetical protein CSOJ01_10014 [Colletotrichum sojae]|uniref:G domain-containing protein n=1 Tax=Colletotrichum sojae TaxID=2175907 RepID=A0A8H6MQL2_9PEZI|nr:hypothetical protein CSOJ01_10014 [Colletotrichum sojae]